MQYFGFLKQCKALFAAMLILSAAQPKTFAAKCPCDIYKDGATPCAVAHSTVRALYSSYNGPLYQVRRVSDNKRLDVGVLSPGGFANTAPQDSFLKGASGRISVIYDQSPNHQNLTHGKGGTWPPDDTEANPADAKIKVCGHTVYGIYTYGGFSPAGGTGYRNDTVKAMVTGNAAEGMYAVLDAKHYNNWCCFDYGNAETSDKDDGNGTMECIYYGSSTQFEHCGGSGPWIRNDMENGMSCGAERTDTSNHSIDYKNINYLTAIVKGKSTNWHSIRGGDAQKGNLFKIYAGKRPTGYESLKLNGAVILGTGGDNSHSGVGTFFEGAITVGCPSDTTEDAIQANILAAGYGSATLCADPVSAGYCPGDMPTPAMFKVKYDQSTGIAKIGYSLRERHQVDMNIVDQKGRQIARLENGAMASGRHSASWDAKRAPAGVYACRVTLDGVEAWTGKVIVGK